MEIYIYFKKKATLYLLSTKELHSQKSKNEDEQKEKKNQAENRPHAV